MTKNVTNQLSFENWTVDSFRGNSLLIVMTQLHNNFLLTKLIKKPASPKKCWIQHCI